tara:strand:+ start:1307 stop:1963 length:657 start_codon:yes stop_codon:yes gene_type:complete
MTYDELVTNIRNYTEVDSNVFTNPVINTFITMAENRILRDIDLDVFKLEATANTTASNRFLIAPSDILTHRYLMVTIDGDQVFLDFRDTSFMKEYWPDSTVTGTPKYYSVWDQNTFYIAPTPAQNYDVQLGYIYRPPQISSANPTTWISTNAPEALLYACLIQAYSYTKGPTEMLQYFENSYKQAIQGLGIEQQGRRRRDEYRDGMIRMPLKSESPGP